VPGTVRFCPLRALTFAQIISNYVFQKVPKEKISKTKKPFIPSLLISFLDEGEFWLASLK
jgi:hypothetical protein